MDIKDNDILLFRLVAEGDEQAFSALFNRFLPRLHPFIVKVARSEAATEEIIQETFIKVWLNRDKLADMDNPGGWVYRVASNICYDHLRERASSNKLFTYLSSEADSLAAPSGGQDVRELKRLVGAAVDALPAQRKKVYLLSREHGKSIPEIAAQLDLSHNTVKNTLVAALKFIREYLLKHGVTFLLLDLALFL